MIQKLVRFRWVSPLIIFFHLVQITGVHSAPPVAGASGENAGGSRYFLANPKGRYVFPVQLWGPNMSGIHMVPDDTTLSELIGNAGGISGSLTASQVRLSRRRPPAGKNVGNFNTLNITGEMLFENPQYSNLKLAKDDIIHMSVEQESEAWSWRDTLSTASVIVGLTTSILTVYLLSRQL